MHYIILRTKTKYTNEIMSEHIFEDTSCHLMNLFFLYNKTQALVGHRYNYKSLVLKCLYDMKLLDILILDVYKTRDFIEDKITIPNHIKDYISELIGRVCATLFTVRELGEFLEIDFVSEV